MPGSTSYKLTLATKSNCVRLSKDIFEKKKQKKQNQNKQRKKNGGSGYVPSRKNGSSCNTINNQ